MAYAQGRVINDADSHIMESSGLAAVLMVRTLAIRDRLISMRLEAGGSGAAKATERALAPAKDLEAATAEIAVVRRRGAQWWLGRLWRHEPRRAHQGLG